MRNEVYSLPEFKVPNIFCPYKSNKKQELDDCFANILKMLNIDLADPNFKETPERMTRMFFELVENQNMSLNVIAEEILAKNFPVKDNNSLWGKTKRLLNKQTRMIVFTPITTYSLCPHHFLPVTYRIIFAYMPKDGRLGLSKVARYIKALSKRAVLQEQLGVDILHYFCETVPSHGAAVYMKGSHDCMRIRGVESDSHVITTELTGCFLKPEIKNEFLSYIRNEDK